METSPSRIFKVLSSDSGLRIFSLLGERKKICVSDISKTIGLSLSATSHQLQKMEAAGLVAPVRDGRSVCYMLNKTAVHTQLLQCVRRLTEKTTKRSQSIY